jgi:hypothetical protein
MIGDPRIKGKAERQEDDLHKRIVAVANQFFKAHPELQTGFKVINNSNKALVAMISAFCIQVETRGCSGEEFLAEILSHVNDEDELLPPEKVAKMIEILRS